MSNRASAGLRFVLRIAGLPPARMIGSVGAGKTRVDGTVSLLARTASVVRAYQAGAVPIAGNVVRRAVSLPIRPH